MQTRAHVCKDRRGRRSKPASFSTEETHPTLKASVETREYVEALWLWLEAALENARAVRDTAAMGFCNFKLAQLAETIEWLTIRK